MSLEVEPTRGPRRFHFTRCLGVGGFGEVYLADLFTGTGMITKVAVKLLHSGLSDPTNSIERLRDEGRLLGLLDHPVILRVTDLIEIDGRTALLMQYVDGCDLDACLKSANPIPEGAVLDVGAQVADALHHAWHTSGPTGERLELVHRDVKPSNIRIGRHGEVKLLDFGIARANVADREAKTTQSMLIGSPPYMAPERFDERVPIAPPSDVFSLGCTLYEGLARRRLFRGLSLKEQYALVLDHRKFTAHVLQAVARLRASNETQTLISEMLAYSPDMRPTAGAVQVRCEALAATHPPTLKAWLRDWTWPVEAQRDAPLVGMTLLEGGPQSSERLRRPPTGEVSGTLNQSRPVAWVAGIAGAVGLALSIGTAAFVPIGLGMSWLLSRPAAAPPAPATPPALEFVIPAPEPLVEPELVEPELVEPELVEPPPAAPPPVEPTASRPPPPKAAPPAAVPVTALRPAEVPVELRGPGGSHAPGALVPGRYEIWADFGEGPVLAGTAVAVEGVTAQLRCSRVKQTCLAESP